MPRSFDVGGILLDPSAPVPRARKGKRPGGATTGIPAKESQMAKGASGGKSRKGRKGRKGKKGARKGAAQSTTTSGPRKGGKSKWRSRGNHWGRQAAAALQVGGYYGGGKKKSKGRGKKKSNGGYKGFMPSVGGRRDVGLAPANGRTTMMGAAGTIVPAGVGIASSMGLNMLYQWGVNKAGGTAASVAGNRWTALWNALTALGLGWFATTRMMPRAPMVRNGLYGAAAGAGVLAVWQLLDSFLRDDATRTGHKALEAGQTAKAALDKVTTPQQAADVGQKVGEGVRSAANALAAGAQEAAAQAGAGAAQGALQNAGEPPDVDEEGLILPPTAGGLGFDPYYIAAMAVGGPDLSALAASSPAGAGEVADRVAQVSEGYTELTGRLQALGEPKSQAEVVVYNMTASALGDMHAALRQANLALSSGQIGAADRFAAYAAQYGVQAESNISGVEAGMAPEIAAAAVTEEVAPAVDLVPPDIAEITDMAVAPAEGMGNGTGGYYPMQFRHVSGQQHTVPAPTPLSVTRFDVGSRQIDFDTISVWAQDAANRINSNLGVQPGMPGYVTASDMALAYVYWWDYYTNKRGYIYGLPQLDAYAGNTWSAVGSSPVAGPQPTAITINGHVYSCGNGNFAELQQAVQQLYNVAA